MATDKQDLLSQITVSKSDLAKAIVTGDKKLVEMVTLQTCSFSLKQNCALLFNS